MLEEAEEEEEESEAYFRTKQGKNLSVNLIKRDGGDLQK